MPNVEVDVKSQTGTSTSPAEVIIKHGLKIVFVTAVVKYMKGADGGMYPRVELEILGAQISRVDVEIKSQTGPSEGPAEITVKHGLKIVAVITGEVKYMKGADGGQYPRVELTQV